MDASFGPSAVENFIPMTRCAGTKTNFTSALMAIAH
jgi:hypothetical protein